MPINFFILICSFICLLFFPELPLLFFAPYLALISLRNSLQNLLLQAIFFGTVVDLFSAQLFGVYMSTYFLGALAISFHAKFLFYNEWSTLPLLTALFAIYSSLAQLFWFMVSGNFFFLDPKYFLIEVFLTSSYDALFAVALLLLHIIITRKRVG